MALLPAWPESATGICWTWTLVVVPTTLQPASAKYAAAASDGAGVFKAAIASGFPSREHVVCVSMN
jgi:hypothetical protein